MDDVCELEIPIFVELKESKTLKNELGVYCTIDLDADQFLGNYKGKIRKSMTQCADPDYVWTILSSRQVPIFYIDASDPKDSNWLRFIRSTSDITQYNVICMQQNQQINYFTHKKILPGEELITYLPKKKLPNRNKVKRSTYSVISTMRYPQSVTENNNGVNTNDIVKLLSSSNINGNLNTTSTSSSKRVDNNKKEKFSKHRSNITSMNKQVIFDNDAREGPTTRSRHNLRRIKSENLISLTTKNSSSISTLNINTNSKSKLIQNTFKNKKIVNKKTEYKCNICSFKCCSWYDVKLHLFKTHLNHKFIRINNKNRKNILKEINKKINFRKKSNFIEYECKYVLDSIIDRIIDNKNLNILSNYNHENHDLNKYCLYKCHYCVNSFFVYKNQLRRHLNKFHNDEINASNNNNNNNEDIVDGEINDDDGGGGGDDDDNDVEYSDSDYDTDNELCLEKKLVEIKILNDNDDLINVENDEIEIEQDEIDFVEQQNDNINDEVDDANDDNDVKTIVKNIYEDETRDCLPDVNKKKDNNDENTNLDVNTINNNGDDDGTQEIISNNSTSASTSNSISPNETNDDDTTKFTCNLCKKQFEDRLTLVKHQRSELSLKMLKKKKELRKKKWRDIHWKRKIDLSYIETTQFNNLSQNIADNLSFCIDGTQEDLKSYNKEVKDYLLTEIGQESDLQMFLKCFPDLYEQLSDQLQIQFMDINLIRKANSYFAQCYYSPKEQQQQQQQQQNNSKLTSTQAICSIYHCKNCRLKFKNLSDLIQHQRFTHNLELKTTFDSYNFDNEQDENVEQPAPIIGQKEKMLNSSPIGYLRCDPYAYIMNLYWDNNDMKKCLKCDNTFLRKIYKKHVESCGIENNDNDNDNDNNEDVVTNDDEMKASVDEKEQEFDENDEASKDTKEDLVEKQEVNEQVTNNNVDNIEENSAMLQVDVKIEPFSEEKQIEIKYEEEKLTQIPEPTHQHLTRSRKRSSRLIDDVGGNLLITKNKRQVTKNSYASEHFVFFDGTNSSYRKSVQNKLHNEYYEINQQKTRQITATVASTSKKTKQQTSNNNQISTTNDESSLNNDDLINDTNQQTKTIPQTLTQTSPSLLATALNSCDNNNKTKVSKRRSKKQEQQVITETKEEVKEEKRSSKRIKKDNLKKVKTDFEKSIKTSQLESNDLDFQLINETSSISQTITTKSSQHNNHSNSSSNKTSTSNLSQIVNTPQSDSTIKNSTEASNSTSANTSFIECDSGNLNESDTTTKQSSKFPQQSLQCEKCSLEFTSTNSVTRHQEKSCLRIHILYLDDNKRKCPICGKTYPSTHHISIHISKYHGLLLGNSSLPPTEEAKKLSELHLNENSNNLDVSSCNSSIIKGNRKKKQVFEILNETPLSPSSSSINDDVKKPIKLRIGYKKRSNSLNSIKNDASKKRKLNKTKQNNSLVIEPVSTIISEFNDFNNDKKSKLKKSLSLSPTIVSKKKVAQKYKGKKASLDTNTKSRKYNRKTLDNSEIPVIGNKKREFKCDNCNEIFKRKSKLFEHSKICKNKLNDNEKKSETVTIENLINYDENSEEDDVVDEENVGDENKKFHKTTPTTILNEDECIIHNDDDDDEGNVIKNNDLNIVMN